MSLNPKKVQFILQKNSSLTQQSEGLFSNSHFCTETTLDSCEIMRAASLLMTLSGSQIILDYNFAPAQQLLQIHHAFKCTHNSENCYFLHCTKMKQLCRHLYKCKNPKCEEENCYISKQILTHYTKCRNSRCLICGPVQEVIRKNSAQNTHFSINKQTMQSITPSLSNEHDFILPNQNLQNKSDKTPQQMLAFYRHIKNCSNSSKCPWTANAIGTMVTQNKNPGPLCSEMKDLWNHVHMCKDSKCQVPDCNYSKSLLSHFLQCTHQKGKLFDQLLVQWNIDNKLDKKRKYEDNSIVDTHDNLLHSY